MNDKMHYCSIFFSETSICELEDSRQQCNTMVRCRQKCTNSLPVPYGYTECTGSYEDDTCTVHCDEEYKLQGDSKIFCIGGVWKNEDAKPASSQCKDIGVCQLISLNHSKFIDRFHITLLVATMV